MYSYHQQVFLGSQNNLLETIHAIIKVRLHAAYEAGYILTERAHISRRAHIYIACQNKNHFAMDIDDYL